MDYCIVPYENLSMIFEFNSGNRNPTTTVDNTFACLRTILYDLHL